MTKVQKQFSNQIRAARKRMAASLNIAGYNEIKSNGNIRNMCNLYSNVFGVSINKEKKYWHFYFLLEQYEDLSSVMNRNVKLVKKITKRNEYKDYIKSYKWSEFSNSIKNQRGNKCEKCGISNVILHCHHLTYDRFKNELSEDVLVVCVPCHEEIHGRKF